MKTSIIILTHNQLEYTKECLRSIRENTKSNYEILVVDNASTDGTVPYLKEQKDITLISNAENHGYAKGNNQGVKVAKGGFIVFLNNDTIVTPGWLEPMINILEKNPKVAMVGPYSNNISGLQQIPVPYNQETLDGLNEFSNQHANENRGKSKQVLRLVGFALMARKDTLDRIGSFDEVFGIGNFEDDDLCLRAIRNGYELRLAKDSFVHHYGSVSFRMMDVDYSKLMNNNQKIFNEKWGFNVSYYTHPRLDIVSQMPQSVKRVLEVGCGAGATSLELKDKYDCETVGIEIDRNAFSIALRSMDKVFLGDIENFDLSRDKMGSFDCIICGDVLEHLKDPWTVVEKLVNLLDSGGYLIISIPNVSNIEVIIHLLEGNFPYQDSGILDKTHLRFFSNNTVLNLLPKNMKVENVNVVTSPLSENIKQFLVLLKRLSEKFGINTRDLETNASIYQFLLRAKKS